MSAFDGIWRPDVQRPGPDAPIEELLLADGMYASLTATPPYRVAADGEPHSVAGQRGFDSLAITVMDDRTVRRTAMRDGAVVTDAVTVLSPFGHTKREVQRQSGSGPATFDFAISSRRVGPGPEGAHAISGRWQPIEADLPNHEEDTEYRVVDGVFSMRDGFGRAFDAPLDGTAVPYLNDARFTTVRCRQLDAMTIEEVDGNDDGVVVTATWHVDPDGHTIHVRFEHADGRIQQQDGQKLG